MKTAIQGRFSPNMANLGRWGLGFYGGKKTPSPRGTMWGMPFHGGFHRGTTPASFGLPMYGGFENEPWRKP